MNTLTDSVDVVVLGGGLAGHCAAYAASEHGASVLLLEKAGEYGGTSAMGPGSLAFAGTPLQKQLGINDSVQLLKADLTSAGGGQASEALLDAYVRLQNETYEWLVDIGFEFKRVEAASHQSVPRSHPISAKHVVSEMHRRYLERQHTAYLSGVKVSGLTRDRFGRVDTVRYLHNGEERSIVVRGGVIVCTGGFTRGDKLIQKFAPELLKAVRMGGVANEGDGLLMGLALGAAVADINYLSGTYGISLNNYPDIHDLSGKDCILLHPIFKGAIAVNRNAKRFADESQSYKTTGRLCLQQPEAVSFQVFDQSIMDESIEGMMPRDFRKAFEAGLVQTSDTIAGLANGVGIDAVALKATVERYNEGVRQGLDSEFGRRNLVGAIGDRVQIVNGPFYIYPCTVAVLATYGGLAVDSEARVLDEQRKPISGVYAAGEVTGGFHGVSYMSGTSLGKAVVFGRVAGANAAAEARRNRGGT